MSKFAGLEGIDLDSKEVFETSDVEEDFEISDTNNLRRESIEEGSLDIELSRSRFEKNMIDAQTTDFSGRIDKLASYETYTVKETRQNKMKRLLAELEGLEKEIDEVEEPNEEFTKLKKLYEKINQKTRRDLKITSLDDLTPETIADFDNSTIESADVSKIQTIETRISDIEKTIGINFKPDSSIQSTINDLFRKYKLLSNDEDELLRIDTTIDSLNAKLEKSIVTRRSEVLKKETDEETMITSLYKNFQSLSEYTEEIPLIIKRLESLNDLHFRAANVVVTVEELDHTISSLKQDFDKWDASLIDMETKLTALNTAFGKAKQYRD